MPISIGPGATGDDVKRIQRALARMLLWDSFGPITGVFDASVATSVKQFQQSIGLPATGIVDNDTWNKLPAYKEPSPTLRVGDAGPVVAWLQQALKGRDVAVAFAPYPGIVDGIFGSLTQDTVRAMQTWAGIKSDGVVGDTTWFTWLTPGSAQQLTLEGACGLLRALG